MITELEELVQKLSKKDKELFNRIYSTKTLEGQLAIPKNMDVFVKNKFSCTKKIEKQKIISIHNNFTGEGSLFNKLRSSRPMKKLKINLRELEKKDNCFFCNPIKKTPEDIFGRIRGKYCITASNIAKYDYFSGLIIFKEHNPLKIKKSWLKDYLEVAEKWFKETKKYDKEIKYNFLGWNCLWRSAASVIHGHIQLISSKLEYGRIKKLEEISSRYNNKFKSDYFLDLFRVHKSLGLGKKIGKSYILFYLTPIKEKEIFIFSKEKRFINLYEIIYKIIKNYLRLGVQAFNLSLFKVKIIGL
jgi:hypothetical protein